MTRLKDLLNQNITEYSSQNLIVEIIPSGQCIVKFKIFNQWIIIHDKSINVSSVRKKYGENSSKLAKSIHDKILASLDAKKLFSQAIEDKYSHKLWKYI